jgi:hypothetical protein
MRKRVFTVILILLSVVGAFALGQQDSPVRSSRFLVALSVGQVVSINRLLNDPGVTLELVDEEDTRSGYTVVEVGEDFVVFKDSEYLTRYPVHSIHIIKQRVKR